jgi:hypothetical protein
MGPGSHLYTRGGHAALLVVRYDSQGQPLTEVYNYGEAHFDDPGFLLDYARGTVKFYLDRPGDLRQTVQKYGMREARLVYRQPLNLSPEQAQRAVAHLEREVLPENRYYDQHHLKAICTTRIRDLLDEVTGGAIRRQLEGVIDSSTVRDLQGKAFAGHPLAGLAGDLFLGRLHDRPIDQYFALLSPDRMRTLFQRIQVGAPGHERPLAEEPVALVEIQGASEAEEMSSASLVFSSFLGVLFFIGAFAMRKAAPPTSRRILGSMGLLWSLFSGGIGLAYAFILLFSSIPEARENELMVVFVVTDLLLARPFWRALRSDCEGLSARWIVPYLTARFGGVAVLCLGRFSGHFFQEPVALVWMGLFALATLTYGVAKHSAHFNLRLPLRWASSSSVRT